MSEADQNTEVTTISKKSRKTKWIVAGILLLFSVVAAMSLPRGFSDDLSRIGKGKAAVVLVRDKNAVESFNLIEVMNSVRDQYAGKVEFLVTDFNTPEGRAFIAANKAERVTVTVIDANGKAANILYPPQTAESLEQAIAGVLGVPK